MNDMRLRDKIINKKAKVAVIGLGYVGLPLAVEFAKKAFAVVGIDIDEEKVKRINKGHSYIMDVPSAEIKPLVKEKKLKATTDFSALKKQDAIIICVPTPLRKTKEPDISFIVSAAEKIAENLRKGQLIILESTTYPGTTDEVILPKMEENGLKVGKDFFLAFSPERVDPGNKKFSTPQIPKVVGGCTPSCTEIARLLYEQIIVKVIAVSSTRVAEMVKLLENTFRSVNIGLVNELAVLCHKMGINVWEVIEGAKTKPFGFMPFYPGPGLGGHCIPIDPLYLSWKARAQGFQAKFIELADEVNSAMPHFVVERITSALSGRQRALKGAKILILGVAYKKDVNDLRESPAFEIINELKENGAQVFYHDPFASKIKLDNTEMRTLSLSQKNLKEMDCVVIVTDHSTIDYNLVLKYAPLILDTRNALRRISHKKVIRL